jgi:ankyrin repeat protein
MFQWVKCQLDSISLLISDKAIRRALEDLPVGLEGTYVRAFANLKAQYPREENLIRRVFWWLVHSLRPLKLEELCELVVLDIGQSQMDFSAVPTNPEDLMQYFAGMAGFTERETNTVGLSHYSIQEFLLSPRILETKVAQSYAGSTESLNFVAGLCITYLSMDDFKIGQCLTKVSFQRRNSTYQAFEYCSSNVIPHFKRTEKITENFVEEAIYLFFTSIDLQNNFLAWKQLLQWRMETWRTDVISLGSGWISQASLAPPIYEVSRFQLSKLVVRLLKAGADVNSIGGEFGYPILAAAEAPDSDWALVQLLIDNGAEVDIKPPFESLLLKVAINNGPNEIIISLIEKGLDVNQKSMRHIQPLTVLQTISSRPGDRVKLVKMLIDRGASINEPCTVNTSSISILMSDRVLDQGPPLSVAARSGNKNVIKLLLAAGADPNFAECELGTPLQASIRRGHFNIANFLLEQNIDLEAEGGALGTALQAASWFGNIDFVLRLLDKGAQVNSGGGYFGSPLNAAVYQGYVSIVILLLKHGADAFRVHPSDVDPSFWKIKIFEDDPHRKPANFMDNYRLNNLPIIHSIYKNNTELMLLLLENTEEINQIPPPKSSWERCEGGRILHPLCAAVETKSFSSLQLLLEHGSNVALASFCACKRAVAVGSVTVLELLLQHSSTLPVPDATIFSMFMSTDIIKSDKTIDLLQSILARVDGIDIRRWGHMLPCAVYYRNTPLVALLLKHGLGPNIKRELADDIRFHNANHVYWGVPLPISIAKGFTEITDLLLSYGADINLANDTKDDEYGSPLHAAAASGDGDLFCKLLDAGANLNNRNRVYGCCPLIIHMAASRLPVKCLETLVLHEADLQEQCDDCETTLLAAVLSENCENIKFLLSHGADVNDLDSCGRTPLSVAMQRGLENAARLLKEQSGIEELAFSEVTNKLHLSVAVLGNKLMIDKSQKSSWILLLWYKLARCFLLGGDIENAAIALDQLIEWRGDTFLMAWGCAGCYAKRSGLGHFCTHGFEVHFCEDFTKSHLFSLGKEHAEQHEFLTFPQSKNRESPEGQVKLADGSLQDRGEWLKDIVAAWRVKQLKRSGLW